MDTKLTHKSQDALSTAVQRAAADGSPQVEPLHLLLALTEQADGTTADEPLHLGYGERGLTAGPGPRRTRCSRRSARSAAAPGSPARTRRTPTRRWRSSAST